MIIKNYKKNNYTPNYIKYISDRNIFEAIKERISLGINGSTVIVPHVCNNINLFGAGFAAAVADYYPEVKANYHLLGSNMKLGHTQFIPVKKDKTYDHEIIFANMIAQNGTINTKNNARPLNYAALVQCMLNIKAYIQQLNKLDKNRIEIHAPKFGSGLAGGNWGFITELMQDVWPDVDISVYTIRSNTKK